MYNPEDLQVVLRALSDVSTDDRTIAILAAFYIDRYLELAACTRLPGLNAEIANKLFDGYGPLTTTAAKIDLAKALGLIDAKF